MTNNLYNLIDNSNLTLIGYTCKNERLKDAFISKFNPVVIDVIDESFSLQSHLRDIRIDSVLSNIDSRYLLIDLSSFRINMGELSKPKIFQKLAEDFRVCSSIMNFRAILTSSMHRTIDGGLDRASFSGGMGPVYVSDLVITFGDEGVKVIKSRTTDNFTIPYKELKENSYI